jgi:AraC-like DNA-binding protein/mannose-6-phosphate isomerase-like protein (cupin superfamily)
MLADLSMASLLELQSMKPQLETIEGHHRKSIHSFRLEVESFDSKWHYHPELELTYIIQGQGIRSCGDSLEVFGPGDLVLVGSKLPHYYNSDSKEEETHIATVIQFREDLFEAFPECNFLGELYQRALLGLYFPRIDDELRKVLETFSEKDPIEQLMLLLHILRELQDLPAETLSSTAFQRRSRISSHQEKLSTINNYILENLNRPIRLSEIAALNHMAEPSFCRWFKKSTGGNFIGHLNKVRVEKACELLLYSEKRISEIAFATGFESISNFNRTFKSLKKSSPSNYRKNKVQIHPYISYT